MKSFSKNAGRELKVRRTLLESSSLTVWSSEVGEKFHIHNVVFLDIPEARDSEPAITDPACMSNLELLESASVNSDFEEFKKLKKECITLYNAGLGQGPEPCNHCQDGKLPQT